MPYSGISDESLPEHIKKLPKHKKEIWVAAWNAAWKSKQDEGYAFRVANAAIKKELTVDEIEKVLDELDKAGARHSAADLKMFDQVATALKDVAAGITEGVLPLLDRLKGIDSMKPADQASEDQPKTEEKPASQPTSAAKADHSPKGNMDMMSEMMDMMQEMVDKMKSMMKEMKGNGEMEKREFRREVGGGTDVSQMPDADFVDPDGRRFPIKTSGDVSDAVSSFGRMGEPKMSFEHFKSRLIAICRRKGFMDALPKSWKEGLKKAENLDERTMMVRRAFDKQFGLDKPDESVNPMGGMEYHPRPYVSEAWDEFAIICVYTEEYEPVHYQASYSKDGDSYTFDDLSNWDQVEKVWQVVPKTRNVIVIHKSSDDEKMLTYGVVLKPTPFIDTQDDAMFKKEIEETAHLWMAESRLYDLLHKNNLDSATVTPVESYIAPQDLTWGDKVVPAGSWVVVSHVRDPKIWKMIKERKINAYSIKGFGHRKEVSYAELAN